MEEILAMLILAILILQIIILLGVQLLMKAFVKFAEAMDDDLEKTDELIQILLDKLSEK